MLIKIYFKIQMNQVQEIKFRLLTMIIYKNYIKICKTKWNLVIILIKINKNCYKIKSNNF